MEFMPHETLTPKIGLLYSDHFVKPYGYYGYRPKGMKDWLLIYTVSGEGTASVKEDSITCQVGDALIFPPDIPHMYATKKGTVWELLWVHFQPHPEWNPWLQLPKTKQGLLHLNVAYPNDRERIESAFRRLIIDSQSSDPSTIQLAFAALSEIVLLLYRSHIQSGQGIMDDRIQKVNQFMTERMSERISLNDIADAAGLSVSRLCHLYKKQVGETIIGTLLKMRLQKAAKLLQYTTHAIQEIAYDTGFDSPFYFSKRFLAQFNVTPTQYRKQTQMKDHNNN